MKWNSLVVSLILSCLFLSCFEEVLAEKVSVKQTQDIILISNKLWKVFLDGNKGWTITNIYDERTGRELNETLFVTSLRPKAYRSGDNGMLPEEIVCERNIKDVTVDVKGDGTDTVVVRRTWKSNLGEAVEETIFYGNNSKFDRTFTLNAIQSIDEMFVDIRVENKWMADRVIFLPEGERVSWGHTTNLPYIEAYDFKTQIGIGMKTTETTPRQARYAWGEPERGRDFRITNPPYTKISILSPILSYEKVPKTFIMKYTGYITTGGSRPIEFNLPPVQVIKVFPEKLIARPSQGNNIIVKLRNNTEVSRNINLKVTLKYGLEEETILADKELELNPQKDEIINLPVNTSHICYGVEALAEVRDKEAGTKDSMKEYFSVHDWTYRVAPTMEILKPPDQGELSKIVPAYHAAYVGIIEVYTWAPNCTFDLTPDTDWYVPQTESQAAYLTAFSSRNLKDFISECHKNGMAVVCEIQPHMPLSYAFQHPEYAKYNAKGEIQLGDCYKIYKEAGRLTNGILPDDFEFSVVSVNLANKELGIAKKWGEEMAESCRQLGWDGVRFDGSPTQFCGMFAEMDPLKLSLLSNTPGPPEYDFWGRPLIATQDEADNLSMENVKTWYEETLKGNPKFMLGFNAGRALLDLHKAGVYPKSMEYAGKQHSYMLYEGALRIGSQEMNTWDKWAKTLTENYRIAQQVGGVMGVGHLRWVPGITQRTRDYTAFASGYRLAYGSSDPYSFGVGETYKACQFAIRFGEFLYDGGYEPLPEDQDNIIVNGHERLMWKYFVRKRSLKDGIIEWLVHIVNRPEGEEADYMLRHHNPPPIRKGTMVTVKPTKWNRVIGAWLLLPEPPRVIPQEWQVESGKINIKLSDIESFATVVVRTKE